MKLLTRTNIYFILIALLVFSLGGKVFYERVHELNKEDAQERLEESKQKVLTYVNINHKLPENDIDLDGLVSYSLASNKDVKDKNGHVKLYNTSEQEYEPYQTLEFIVGVGNQYYKATLYRSLMETDDLVTATIESIIIITGSLLVLMLIANFIISKLLWAPFYSTLGKLKSYDLTKENGPVFDKTKIAEFKDLNEVLEGMTKKMSADYCSLKEFTENASHELQTPLSVIQSKLELLIQSESLSEEQLKNVQSIYESATKLSKLNQALLLLARIENRQFAELKEVSLNELIERKLELLKEWIEHKDLKVEKHLYKASINTNPVLADIFITNLLGNAIKHNTQGGQLNIELADKRMVIKNSGAPFTGPAENLFSRFKKANQASDSLGLGLAIVKEIGNVYGYKICYDYSEGMHRMKVDF